MTINQTAERHLELLDAGFEITQEYYTEYLAVVEDGYDDEYAVDATVSYIIEKFGFTAEIDGEFVMDSIQDILTAKVYEYLTAIQQEKIQELKIETARQDLLRSHYIEEAIANFMAQGMSRQAAELEVAFLLSE